MSGVARGTTSKLIAISVAVALVGCGSNSSGGAPGNAAATAPATTTTTTTTMRPISAATSSLAGVTGELIITRQRDLIDRGLINVLVRNDSDTSMLMSNIELVADFFSAEPAEQRIISVRSGRQIAVQVPYGLVDDCDTDQLVGAELVFALTGDDDPRSSVVRIELEGTDVLDTIRTGHCTARVFQASTRTRFDGASIVDGTVETELVIEPTGSSADLTVEAVSGTILVGARTPDGWSGVRLDEGPVAIPLTFVVNRCDPHALAEVTKRYGLAIAVSVDGAAPVDVAVDVEALVTALEGIVEQCVAETAED